MELILMEALGIDATYGAVKDVKMRMEQLTNELSQFEANKEKQISHYRLLKSDKSKEKNLYSVTTAPLCKIKEAFRGQPSSLQLGIHHS